VWSAVAGFFNELQQRVDRRPGRKPQGLQILACLHIANALADEVIRSVNEAPASPGGTSIDPHSMDLASVLALARSLGEISAELYILGCEPATFGTEDGGCLGLSPEVAAQIPEVVRMVRELAMKLINRAANCAAATQGGLMKNLAWIAAGVAALAMFWRMAPDLRRYLKMQSM